MNRDTEMKRLGHITTAYERFRAAIGRSDRSYDPHQVKAMLEALQEQVQEAMEELFPGHQ